jgi:hypothetical protein
LGKSPGYRQSKQLIEGLVLRAALSYGNPGPLAFLEHMPGLRAVDSPPCRGERAHPPSRIDPAFDTTLLLCYHVLARICIA